MLTVLEIIKRSTEFLAARGVEQPRLQTEHLVGHALGLKRMQLYLQFERPLTESELEKIRPLMRRRGAREPLQYIIGETDFAGVRLKCDRRALIPRPETERLVELLGERLKDQPPATVLDLGTGSGAIALAVTRLFPGARVTALDASAEALALARENAAAGGIAEPVQWLVSDWFTAVPAESRFALIVANPPYLSAAETAETAAEVKNFEPAAALTATGADGGDALRAILAAAPRFLEAGGLLALETGIAQHAMLRAAAQAAGFARVESAPDLTGRDRYIFARRD